MKGTPAALILAGSRPGTVDPVAAAEGVAHKAVVEVMGQTALSRVDVALKGAGIDRIVVAANDPTVIQQAEALQAEVLPPASGPSESAGRALDQCGAPLLVTTADHALLQAQWVRDFLADCPADADVAILLARRPDVEAAAPDTKRTWLRFADGEWSGCNMFLLATPQAENAVAVWRQVEADRKRPWRIARRLGVGTLWAYWRGKLTLAEAVARLGNTIGVRAAIVAARDGRAAIDVDTPGDLALVRELAAKAD